MSDLLLRTILQSGYYYFPADDGKLRQRNILTSQGHKMVGDRAKV